MRSGGWISSGENDLNRRGPGTGPERRFRMLPKKRSSHHAGHRLSKKKRTGIILGAVAYILLLSAVFLLPKLTERGTKTEPDKPGNGAELFESEVRYRSGEDEYVYRENELTTLLLIGVDREELSTAAAVTARSNTQADFLTLIVLDRKNRTVTPVQIDRDAIVPVEIFSVLGRPNGMRELQVCLAQGFGKTADENCRNTARAVSRLLLGVPVDHYMAYGLNAIDAFNELLGGVTVTVEDDFSDLDPALVPGRTVTLKGAQAETFVRGRHFVGDGTNVSRLRRQRAFMESALADATAKSRADSGFVHAVMNGMEGLYVSDMNRGYVINLLNRALSYSVQPFRVTEGEHTVSEKGFMECAPDKNSIEKMMLELCFEKR